MRFEELFADRAASPQQGSARLEAPIRDNWLAREQVDPRRYEAVG